MSACCMCAGTDCAGQCAQGQCYWEHQQWQAEQQAREDAMWDQHYEDSLLAAQAIGDLAMELRA